MKKLGFMLAISSMLIFVCAGCAGIGGRYDNNVVKYINEKYGFTPVIVSSEQEVDSSAVGVLVSKNKSGIYDYVLKDENGKQFELKYYSDTKTCMDNYLKDFFTEEMSDRMSKMLNVEFDDLYFEYSNHNMLGLDGYDTLEEILKNNNTKLYATTYDDFGVYDFDDLNEYKMEVVVAKIDNEYTCSEKINLNDITNFSNWLMINYVANKNANDKEIKVRDFIRIRIDEDIIYVHDERYDDQLFITPIDDNQIFENADSAFDVISPVYNINSGKSGHGLIFFTGKYYKEYDKDKTIILEKYEKNGNVINEAEGNALFVADKCEAIYYNHVIGDITIALGKKQD